MSNQNSQSHKRNEDNNTEWLDELINEISLKTNELREEHD